MVSARVIVPVIVAIVVISVVVAYLLFTKPSQAPVTKKTTEIVKTTKPTSANLSVTNFEIAYRLHISARAYAPGGAVQRANATALFVLGQLNDTRRGISKMYIVLRDVEIRGLQMLTPTKSLSAIILMELKTEGKARKVKLCYGTFVGSTPVGGYSKCREITVNTTNITLPLLTPALHKLAKNCRLVNTTSIKVGNVKVNAYCYICKINKILTLFSPRIPTAPLPGVTISPRGNMTVSTYAYICTYKRIESPQNIILKLDLKTNITEITRIGKLSMSLRMILTPLKIAEFNETLYENLMSKITSGQQTS